jgi:hypothetical protein
MSDINSASDLNAGESNIRAKAWPLALALLASVVPGRPLLQRLASRIDFFDSFLHPSSRSIAHCRHRHLQQGALLSNVLHRPFLCPPRLRDRAATRATAGVYILTQLRRERLGLHKPHGLEAAVKSVFSEVTLLLLASGACHRTN